MYNPKTIVFSILLLGFCFGASASNEYDSLGNTPVKRVVPFLALGMENIVVDGRTILEREFSAGITINQKLNLGVFSSWNVDYFSFEKIGLPALRMKYMQGGVLTSYDHRVSQMFSLNIGSRVGQGSARLLNHNDDAGITKQRVVIVHPDMGLEVSPFHFVKIKLNFGYRLMTDLKMQEVLRGDLTGFSYGINLKLDLFTRKYMYNKRSYSFTHRP